MLRNFIFLSLDERAANLFSPSFTFHSKIRDMNALISEITNEQLQDDRSNFKVGDGVKVHTRVREGEKTRIQIFAGIVIARKGASIHIYRTSYCFGCRS